MYKVSLQLFTELFGNFPNMGEGGLLNPKTLFRLRPFGNNSFCLPPSSPLQCSGKKCSKKAFYQTED